MSNNEEKKLRSKIMSAIKSTDTSVELKLRKALWHKGYRYRKNDKTVYGTPDIVFKKYRIAVFVDSEFFHGYNWGEKKKKLKNNKEYWINKIERNIKRDNKVNAYLISKGWKVIRFWDKEVNKNLFKCIKKIEYEIDEMRGKLFYL